MIQPLITLVIILPIIVGILSVDMNGERISVREFLKSDAVVNFTRSVENALPSNPSPETSIEKLEQEEEEELPEPQPLFDLKESGEALDNLNRTVAEGITFLIYSIRDFGIWIGMSTAPFHHFVAVLIAFAMFPAWGMYIVGFFYIIIKERKEIRQEIHNARVKKDG